MNVNVGEDWIVQATKFGDGIAVDHRLFNEENESRLHHRYAVVVQDSDTQRTQSYPCKYKNPSETMKSLQRSFLEEASLERFTLIVGFFRSHKVSRSSVVESRHTNSTPIRDKRNR